MLGNSDSCLGGWWKEIPFHLAFGGKGVSYYSCLGKEEEKSCWISFWNQFLGAINGGNKTINFYFWQKKFSSPVIIIANQVCIVFCICQRKSQLNLPLKWNHHLGFFFLLILSVNSVCFAGNWQVELNLFWALLNGHGVISNKNRTNSSHSCLSKVCPNMGTSLRKHCMIMICIKSYENMDEGDNGKGLIKITHHRGMFCPVAFIKTA